MKFRLTLIVSSWHISGQSMVVLSLRNHLMRIRKQALVSLLQYHIFLTIENFHDGTNDVTKPFSREAIVWNKSISWCPQSICIHMTYGILVVEGEVDPEMK